MLRVELEAVIAHLKEFAWGERKSLEIILIGGIAIQYYGMKDRATIDIDAEIKGNVEGLFNFLKARDIPSDIGENISGWSVIGMPEGYKERAIEIYRDEFLTIKVLLPLDFVIAKLRRFSEEDINDALFVVRRYDISPSEIKEMAEEAIKNSPKDTALFQFRRNVDIFISMIQNNST